MKAVAAPRADAPQILLLAVELLVAVAEHQGVAPALRRGLDRLNQSHEERVGDVGDNQGILLTPVLNIYFANSVVLRSGIDLYFYKDATGESKSARELKFSWQANF